MSVILCLDSRANKDQYSMPEQLAGFYLLRHEQLMYNSKAQRASFFASLMTKVEPGAKIVTVVECLSAQKQMQCKTLLWVFNDLEVTPDMKLSVIDPTGEQHPVDGLWHSIRREPTSERYRAMSFYPETGTYNIPPFSGASMFDTLISLEFAHALNKQFKKYTTEK